MDFGFVFMGDCHVHGDVKFAEDHGFSHAWLYDTQMLGSEVYAALALCADRTSTIKLGPGVTNPKSRIAPLSACGMATSPRATAMPSPVVPLETPIDS